MKYNRLAHKFRNRSPLCVTRHVHISQSVYCIEKNNKERVPKCGVASLPPDLDNKLKVSRAHERYRQTDDRQTTDRRIYDDI